MLPGSIVPDVTIFDVENMSTTYQILVILTFS